MNLDTNLIYDAVYQLCERANVRLPRDIYEKLKTCSCVKENVREQILQNAFLANKNKRPLCQDTGQVVVFLKIGQNVHFTGNYIENAVNRAVEDCYVEKLYRKSVVTDALKNRTNTTTNTPAIIHTQIVKGDEVEILLALKGGGAENTSQVKMFNPTAEKREIFDFVKKVAQDAGENACPPMMLGVGIGGTIEKACFLAKYALYKGEIENIEIENVFETRVLSAPTHIASLPVCVNVNCHSARHSECKIRNNKIIFDENSYEIPEIPAKNNDVKEIFTYEIEKIKSLKKGEKIELSGTIFTARDAAHKKLVDMIEKGEKLPIELKNAIIFYAGPCPSASGEIIGPIGPTTSKRMDKFAPILYKQGVLATIGKGDREIDTAKNIYFKATGGIASYLKDCVKSCKIMAFKELCTEAIYQLDIENFPVVRA